MKPFTTLALARVTATLSRRSSARNPTCNSSYWFDARGISSFLATLKQAKITSEKRGVQQYHNLQSTHLPPWVAPDEGEHHRLALPALEAVDGANLQPGEIGREERAEELHL